jgi:hypothetical protein
VISSADFQKNLPSGLRHKASSRYAVNAGRTSAMLINAGDDQGGSIAQNAGFGTTGRAKVRDDNYTSGCQ